MVCFVKKVETIILTIILINNVIYSCQLDIFNSQKTGSLSTNVFFQFSWNKYHNYSEIVNFLKKLNESYSEIAKIYSIGKTWNNRDIWCIELSSHVSSKPKPALFIVSYHHARERITIEVALYIAWYLATNYATSNMIRKILDQAVIYIIPALNADGIEISEINPWQRKNLRPIDEDGDGRVDEDPPNDVDGDGDIYQWWNNTFLGFEGIDDDGDGLINEDWLGGVDLNRNYDFHWNDTEVSSGSSDPHSEVYIGLEPFSEPETQAIKNFVETHENIKYAISFHSGTEAILYPWGYTHDPPPDEEEFVSLAEDMSEISGYPYFQAGELYTCSGELGDWMYGVHQIFAFTIEVYGQYANSTWMSEHTKEINGTFFFYDVREYFNPPKNKINKVLERNMRIILHLSSKLISKQSFIFYTVFSLVIISIIVVVLIIIVKKSREHTYLKIKRLRFYCPKGPNLVFL